MKQSSTYTLFQSLNPNPDPTALFKIMPLYELYKKIEEAEGRLYKTVKKTVPTTESERSWDRECAESHGRFIEPSYTKTVSVLELDKDMQEVLNTLKQIFKERLRTADEQLKNVEIPIVTATPCIK